MFCNNSHICTESHRYYTWCCNIPPAAALPLGWLWTLSGKSPVLGAVEVAAHHPR